MDEAALNALREKVAQEPEGSPARLLLAELDRVHAAAKRQAEASLRSSLMMYHFLSPDEAARVASGISDFEMERGACRACKGSGRKTEPGCMGARHSKCQHCHGRGVCTRIKVPDATV